MKLLNGASDWKVSVDLKTSLQFPVHIIQTEKQPNIVAWSDSKKCVFFIELTISGKENRKEVHEWKKNQYKTLHVNCMEKGYAMWFLLRLVVMVFLDTQAFHFF